MASSHSPNTENLRKQAKALLRAWRENSPDSVARVAEHYPDGRNFGLQDAQFVLAREYGFRSWSALLEFVPRMGYFSDVYTFHISREFDVSLERLWTVLSKPEEIGDWLLPVTFEPIVGSPYAFASQPKLSGIIGVYDRQRAIRFDSAEDAFWSFAIEPAEESEGTQLRLSVIDRMTIDSVDQYSGGIVEVWNPGVTAGWHQILDALDHVLTGRQLPDVDYSRLCLFYERLIERFRQ
ncbi:MAG: SRPBCC domain-containing protein [Gammaproteobacteria bacterium]|nr:SRPBCC domain-containing protein [Gammaproteobacteria bacterium]